MSAEPRDGEREEAARLRAIDFVGLAPTAVRLGAVASARAAGWATSSTMAGWKRLARAIREGESPGALLDDVWREARGAAREALGVTDIAETLDRMTSDGASPADTPPPRSTALRDRGAELLASSAEVSEEDDETHPAFGVVLEELSPDELRILRVLVSEGDQAAVDVEAGGPLGVGSTTILRRRSRIAEVAGCRHPEKLQLYLDNLLRLGLIRISDDDPLDEGSYDVLEAQPEVSEALEDASSGTRRAKVVPLRLELSDFGQRFCETCVPLEGGQEAPRPD
jgi:hypothetical protein